MPNDQLKRILGLIENNSQAMALQRETSCWAIDGTGSASAMQNLGTKLQLADPLLRLSMVVCRRSASMAMSIRFDRVTTQYLLHRLHAAVMLAAVQVR